MASGVAAEVRNMATSVRDPVCGIPIDPAKARSVELDGVRYAFCSVYCLNAFRWNPRAYAAAARTRSDEGTRTRQIAYLSMEVAIDPRLPTYSGGLGVLAGDTLRSCAFHLNEGHASLAALELLRRQGAAAHFDAIRECVVFTTHTPAELERAVGLSLEEITGGAVPAAPAEVKP